MKLSFTVHSGGLPYAAFTDYAVALGEYERRQRAAPFDWAAMLENGQMRHYCGEQSTIVRGWARQELARAQPEAGG